MLASTVAQNMQYSVVCIEFIYACYYIMEILPNAKNASILGLIFIIHILGNMKLF